MSRTAHAARRPKTPSRPVSRREKESVIRTIADYEREVNDERLEVAHAFAQEEWEQMMREVTQTDPDAEVFLLAPDGSEWAVYDLFDPLDD